MAEYGIVGACLAGCFFLLHSWARMYGANQMKVHKDHQQQVNQWQEQARQERQAWYDDAREERRETLAAYREGNQQMIQTINNSCRAPK